VAAGGDGTVATIAHGLIDSNVILCSVLANRNCNEYRWNAFCIPNNLGARCRFLIKLGNKQKIDLGQIIKLDGES